MDLMIYLPEELNVFHAFAVSKRLTESRKRNLISVHDGTRGNIMSRLLS